jgi:DNA polymerase elongation subunit (family B)
MRLIEVEPLTAPPVAGLDEMWNTLDAKPIKKVPLLRLYGTTPAGQKCSVTVHNAYPYFFVNIPESVLQQHDTYEKLAGYATQFAHALNRATQLNLASKSLDAQYIHMISVVQAKPFYGYSPDHELYFKIFLYNPLLVTRVTTLLRNKTVMGVAFRIFESHIPYNLQFFIDYKIYGMGYINFSQVKYRLPLPEPRNRPRIILNDSVYRSASQGALCLDLHTNSSVSNAMCLLIPKDTQSELEVDVDVSFILEPSSGDFSSPNTSHMALPEQLVPSLTYIWDDERQRRYEAAKLANPGVTPTSQSLGLGSVFDSTHERLVDGPHDFHQSIIERFRKLVEKDESDARTLFSETAPLFSQPGSSAPYILSKNAPFSATPMASAKFKELSMRMNQQNLDAIFREASQVNTIPLVDEELASSQTSDLSLLEALEWMRDDDWDNENWESKIGRESDAKAHGFATNEEEEHMLNDREVEAILASQREVGEQTTPTDQDIIDPVPNNSKKRDRDDVYEISPEDRLFEDLLAQKTRKKVTWSDTTQVLLFHESDLHPYAIQETGLRDKDPPDKNEPSSLRSASEDSVLNAISPPSSIIPSPKIASNALTGQIEPVLQAVSSQDPAFVVESTQLNSSESMPVELIAPVRMQIEPNSNIMMDSEELSVAEITTLASDRFATKFARSLLRRRPLAVRSVTPPQELPQLQPMASSGEMQAESSSQLPFPFSAPLVLPRSLSGSRHSELLPSGSHSSEKPQGRRPLILKFNRPPPNWETIYKGMKALQTPIIRYQGPFYGDASDKPAKTVKFAGISIPVETANFDALQPFSAEYATTLESSISLPSYHAIGAARQLIRKRGKEGLVLRALTPGRPPPIVYLYPPSESSENSTVLEDIEKEEEDVELIANSPKLGEQFRLVASVRPTSSKSKTNSKESKKKQNIQQILDKDQATRRGPPSFSQPETLSMASQIDRAVPTNPSGFALRPEARRNLGGNGLEGITMLSLEVFATSNGNLRPDPHISPIEAIYVCWRDDFEIRQMEKASDYQDHIAVLCRKRSQSFSETSIPLSVDMNRVERHEYDTEVELLIGFRDFLVKVDPDIVMGYECQQHSLGYIFERALILNLSKYISSFGRASGDLGNQFENTADSWGYQHASGISMVGRIVFNVWRIMRSELALQSYSFESIAYHILHQRIPHYDHTTLTRWYTGLQDLGPPHTIKSSTPSKPSKAPKAAPKAQNSQYASNEMDIDTTEAQNQLQDPADAIGRSVAESQMSVDAPCDVETLATISGPHNFKADQTMESDVSMKTWPFAQDRWRTDSYYLERAQCNFYLLDALNVISRTSEFARMYGITFYSVLSRGSQYRVESLMLRMTKPRNYVCVSPTRQQVAQQLAPESIPLVMEPLSAFYTDPVLVLDFQSLYPSVIIGYNLCFSTCLGKIGHSNEQQLASTISKRLGVLNYEIPVGMVSSLKDDIYCAANGVMYVKPELRTGTVPRMLHEILETRVMVKESMKLVKHDPLTWAVLDARQLGLKMIANVTYGYASASFSGRMPCVDVADSIVQTGRETLERAIKLINSTKEWGAKVVYGDTDSVFVLLKGATKERAFQIGNEIAHRVTDDNPWPVKLKFEKCYLPCVLLAKKRYVGYMYEHVDQETPIFDAKGIETVRRDTCPAVSKILERSLRLLFETKNLSIIKSYLRTQWTKILTGRVSLMDFIFRKEVRLGTYRGHHAPPAALVAMKEVEKDPRAAPRYGERVPYLVINGTNKARLIDLVFHPLAVTPDSGMTINTHYYITRNIIPVLSRVFNLFGVSIADWFQEMPKRLRNAKSTHHTIVDPQSSKKKTTIDQYYTSQYCPVCDALCATPICDACQSKPALSVFILASRMKLKTQKMHRLLEICMQCSSNPARSLTIDCDSLDCQVYFQRAKYSSEAHNIASYQSVLQNCESMF